MHRALLIALLGLLAAAPAARADLAQLKAACQTLAVEDAPAFSYRFCDDGVPDAGGRTPNRGADRAVAVPAAYAGVEGLPPPDAAATSVPGSADGTVALDVDVSLPDRAKVPPPPGGYPLLALMHGCCAGSKAGWEGRKFAEGGERWHYNSAWFAARGYVVLTYTARGFVDGSNRGSTGESHVDSLQFEMNDLQHLAGQLADDPFFEVDPRRVVATGGSYGGGWSWLALTDPLWKSPGGKEMRLAAVAPKYGWTDVLSALVPTGRHFYDEGPLPAVDGSDTGFSPPGGAVQKVGIPIRSIINGLFLSGDVGFPNPPPNNAHTTFAPDIRESYNCTATVYPIEGNPLCAAALAKFIPESVAYRSAYYRNGFFEKVRTDPAYRIPVFSAGTLTDPLFPPVEHRRMAERLKATFPGYPIQEYYGDFQHFAQNKAKEWNDICGEDRHVCVSADYPAGDFSSEPVGRVREGITTQLNRFLDHYARPPGAGRRPAEPARDVTASLQVCPENAVDGQRADEPGPTFTARSFDALTPGELAVEFSGDQETVHDAAPNSHATATDPIVNSATNGSRCPVHTDHPGPGVAVYDSGPLPAAATMIGGGILTVAYRATGDLESLQLNARLYDLFPDGRAVMVDRGPRRIDPRRDGTERVSFQLHGNGWRFPEGHRIRLELAQDDDPYLHASNPVSAMTISRARLVLPVRETRFGRDVEGPEGDEARDRTAPVVRLRVPRYASDAAVVPRLPVRWTGSDVGRGIRTYRLQARRLSSRRWRAVAGARATTRTSVRFSGRAGVSYELRVRAIDRAGNASRWAHAVVTFPVDERAAALRGPWRRSARERSAWSGTLAACAARACRATLRFRGRSVAIIGPRRRRASSFVAVLDGRRRVVRIARAVRPAPRQVLVVLRARGRSSRRHTLVVTPRRGGGTLRLDAFAPR